MNPKQNKATKADVKGTELRHLKGVVSVTSLCLRQSEGTVPFVCDSHTLTLHLTPRDDLSVVRRF